jgi:hypothetical protein
MTVEEAIKRLRTLDKDEHIAILWFEKDEIDEDLSDKSWIAITEEYFSNAGDELSRDWLTEQAYDSADYEEEDD